MSEAPPGLLESLGVSVKYIGKNQFDYLVEVESEAALRNLAPDFKRLATVPVRGIIVTSGSNDSRFNFVSRFFAPASGVDEDPVTVVFVNSFAGIGRDEFPRLFQDFKKAFVQFNVQRKPIRLDLPNTILRG